MHKIIGLLVKFLAIASVVVFLLIGVVLVIVLYKNEGIPVWYSIFAFIFITGMMTFFIWKTVRSLMQIATRNKKAQSENSIEN